MHKLYFPIFLSFLIWAAVYVLRILLATVLLFAPSAVLAEQRWGETVDGLQTRIIPVSKSYSLAGPMKFRVEIRNTGESQVHHLGAYPISIVVLDSSGNEVPKLHLLQQRAEPMGGALDPKQVAVLIREGDVKKRLISEEPKKYKYWTEYRDEFDIAGYYLIDKPGKYSILFREQRLPSSNTLKIEFASGKPPLHVALAGILYSIRPPNVHLEWADSWKLRPHAAKDPNEQWNGVTLRGESREDEISIAATNKLREIPADVPEEQQKQVKYLGKSQLFGHVYLQWEKNRWYCRCRRAIIRPCRECADPVNKFWPNAAEQIHNAIGDIERPQG